MIERVPLALRRAAFVLYAMALFTLTHWPGMAIESEIRRPDLYIHVAAFGLWTALAAGAGLFGPVLSARNVLCAALAGALYAALDEGLQALPALDRHATWDDLLANLAGVALATGAGLLAGRVRRLRDPRASG